MDCVATILNMVKGSTKKPPQKRGPAKKIWHHIYLREWREFKGLSVEGLAAKSGVSSGQISLIENRQSSGSADSLEKLAKALGITVGELLDIRPEKGGSVVRIWVHDDDKGRLVDIAETFSKHKSK